MLIVKRDGTQVQFDRDKIINAINKAFIEVDGKLYETDTAYDIAVEIEQAARQLAEEDRMLSVESIQDLLSNNYEYVEHSNPYHGNEFHQHHALSLLQLEVAYDDLNLY